MRRLRQIGLETLNLDENFGFEFFVPYFKENKSVYVFYLSQTKLEVLELHNPTDTHH